MKFSATDLITNRDGSIYHLHLKPEMVSDKIILVGDPGRVGRVSRHFEKVEFKVTNREFVTHTGFFKGKRISVLSTGIGTDTVEIVVTELDALFNVDFKSRRPKPKPQQIELVRVGTSGSLQEDIPLGSFLVSRTAIGFDNLINFYNCPATLGQRQLCSSLRIFAGLPFTPYAVDGSKRLLKNFKFGMFEGLTVTAPGFYGPQGRSTRKGTRFPDLLEKLSSFRFQQERLTNFEMETSGLYALARIMGHDAISLNAILASRTGEKFASNPTKIIDELIRVALERI